MGSLTNGYALKSLGSTDVIFLFKKMCGILLVPYNQPSLAEKNSKRGPDAQSQFICQDFTLFGYVLHLRGQLVPQPLVIEDHVLCFNGELYEPMPQGNDTLYVMEQLILADNEEAMLEAISQLKGEFAFVYYRPSSRVLYYGRDYLGRRSLLWNPNQFALASVGDHGDWLEVPTTGLFKMDFSTATHTLLPWNENGSTRPSMCLNRSLPPFLLNSLVDVENSTGHIEESDAQVHKPPRQKDSKLDKSFNQEDKKSLDVQVCEPLNEKQVNKGIDETIQKLQGIHLDLPINELYQVLLKATRVRVETIPAHSDARLGILFSGGLDCMALAALAHLCLPLHEPIDLLNVSFENPRIMKHKTKHELGAETYQVPDRITGHKGAQELQDLFPRPWRFVEINVTYDMYCEFKPWIIGLMKPLHTVMDLSIAAAFWFASRGQGLLHGEPYTSTAKVLLSGLGADEQVFLLM